MRGSGTHAPERSGGRISSLDGLRGVAGLAVVVTHLLVASSAALGAPFQNPRTGSSFPSFNWWITYTPLHILWAGQEAVIVFFVLSGFVLAWPAARGRGFRVLSYYPRRLVRLYVPAWGAVVVGAILHAAFARHAVPGTTFWLAGHTQPLSVHGAVRDATLLRGAGGSAIDPVLWTLQWELWFSLLLPAYLLAGVISRRIPATALALAAAALVAIGRAQQDSAWHYMPMFLLGALVAYHHEALGAGAARVLRGRAAQAGAVVVCIVLLTASWWLAGGNSGPRAGLGHALAAAGGALAIVLALFVPALERGLRRRPAQWLGTRAYSIYLVHEPVLVTLGFAVGARPSVLFLFAVALPAALIAAELFFRGVEGPSHDRSRRIGRAIDRAVDRRRRRVVAATSPAAN